MNEYKGRDLFYYSDLIYKIKSLAGISTTTDLEVENRILKREEMIADTSDDNIISYNLSIFELEVFDIVRTISKRVGKSFNSLYDIAKYPEIVSDTLDELEKKKLLYNNFIIKRTFSVLAVPYSMTREFECNDLHGKSL